MYVCVDYFLVSVLLGERLTPPIIDCFSCFGDIIFSWIVDSGVNRHMVGSSKGFHNYIPCKKGNNVWVTNGSLALISGTCSVRCFPNIKLFSILYISHLPMNLLSINFLTKDLNCK